MRLLVLVGRESPTLLELARHRVVVTVADNGDTQVVKDNLGAGCVTVLDTREGGEEVAKLTKASEVPTTREEFMGVIEVAKELGVTMSNLDRVAGLPEPYQRLSVSGKRLWKADEIREFAEMRRAARAAQEKGAA